jgi:predicted nucleic acid-binding protein
VAFDGQRLVAVDTGLLYGDSWGGSHHRKALKYLRETLRHQLVICTTVIREILITEKEGSDKMKLLTHIVKQDIEDSDYFIHATLDDTYEKIISDCADKCLEAGLLPKGKKNDARIIIEASHFNCDELMSVRQPILEANQKAVNDALKEHGFGELKIFSPKLFGT